MSISAHWNGMCFPRVSTSSAITPYLSHVAVLDTQRVHEVLSLLAVVVNDMFVSWGRQVEVRECLQQTIKVM